MHAVEAHEAQDQAQLGQHIDWQPHAAAERAGDEEGAAFVAPPALDQRDGGVEAAAAQQRGARAKARPHRRMQRAETHLPLDPELERVDLGGLVERGADRDERCVERRSVRDRGTPRPVPVTPFTRAVRHEGLRACRNKCETI